MDQQFLDAIIKAPLIPTVYPDDLDVEGVCTYADILADEGYPAAEFLCRPAEKTIALARQTFARPQRDTIKWGIGTLRTRDVAVMAAELKPDFLVSPAFSRNVLEVAVEANLPYIPAVHTLQDVQDVLDAFAEVGREVKVLKLCPVYNLTIENIETFGGCYPGIVFCPTGEVELHNYIYYKQIDPIVAPMGSANVPRKYLAARDFEGVRRRLRLYRMMAEEVEHARKI